MPYIIRPPRVAGLAAGLIATVALIGAAPAAASQSCPQAQTSHAFQQFGDSASYALVEGGLFEAGAPGWSLRDAQLTYDSPELETQGYGEIRHDSGHWGAYASSHALAIYRGGYAVSPPFCVNSEYPSFRFLERALWGDSASLAVSLRWTDSGGVHETSDEEVQAGDHWTLSPVLELASRLPSGTTPNVQLVFHAQDGSVEIDDVYIDPYSR